MALTNADISTDSDAATPARQAVAAALVTLPQTDAARAAAAEGREVASLVRSLGLPDDVVLAVELCAPLRDGVLDVEKLQNKDLGNIPNLVSELVTLSRFALPPDWTPGEALATHQSDALRRMLLAVVSDVRLVLARLAEQLWRLRRAKTATLTERHAMAVETREIYAVLANRLGVWQLKWELEDLAFRYLEPDTYASIAGMLHETRHEREAFIERVARVLKDELDRAGIPAEVTGRPKHIYSIWRKMQRKDRSLESLHDIRAVRVLVDDVTGCYAALGVVHNLWSYLPGEFDDYIANPKDNEYRSLHTAVVGPEGKTLEVQIRSHEMHRQAELGVAAHWRYKEGGGAPPAAFDRKIRFLRQLLEPAGDAGDLLDQIRDDVFEDRVYAISPKGDVVELPAGATPLDFAYQVHTQVGHKCRGAKVNGRIVPLTHKVKNGDQIEIITGGQPNPSRDWLVPRLGYLAGARNRAKVRNWFRQQDRDQHLRQGRDILDRELMRLGVRDMPTDAIARQLKHKDTESLCVLLGSGELAPAAVASALQQLTGAEPRRNVRPARQRRRAGAPDGVAVSGVGDLLCNFARCCRPVPPEPIAGYITLGRGVTVHREDCGNFANLETQHPERVIAVAWGETEAANYPVDLTLRAFDRAGLIRDVTAVLADEGANILDLQSRVSPQDQQVTMRLSVEIADLPTLSTAIARLEQLPNVTAVSRRS
ncbi:MAG TPA: bifunctional (p)ppGpp synthetase/guanosine-3',5'-bis(diphosphate) 3'-pyrophosphohydrolase [Woeseiaceae bacterium]|nr:bifunctional (p)ppGpp synthetase/guanosine-3',5'-bis(diphosphate) 3'-pyrophosphohydrolase [Woeseiaceae bacterium]